MQKIYPVVGNRDDNYGDPNTNLEKKKETLLSKIANDFGTENRWLKQIIYIFLFFQLRFYKK